ncbi:MAG: hypothetical protein WC222_05725 [Parachlamydiales bacterium]
MRNSIFLGMDVHKLEPISSASGHFTNEMCAKKSTIKIRNYLAGAGNLASIKAATLSAAGGSKLPMTAITYPDSG